MKALSIETSTRRAGIAFFHENELLFERFLPSDITPSKGMHSLIVTSLSEHKIELRDIDLIVVDVGPGSFVGIRVGLSTAMGLGFGLDKPVVGVSSFEAIAGSVRTELPIAVWIDSKQKDLYHALLRLNDASVEFIKEPVVGKPEELLNTIEPPCLFVGDGALKYRELIRKRLNEKALFAECALINPSPAILGILGIRKFMENKENAKNVEPFYLKNFVIDKN